MEQQTEKPTRQSKRKRNVGQALTKLVLDDQLEWCQPVYADAPVTPIDEDDIQAIHNASMKVLEDVGVLFLNDAALRVFDKNGCKVDWDSKRVRMDRAFVTEQVAKAPSHITVTPRNPDRALIFWRRHFNFGQAASPQI